MRAIVGTLECILAVIMILSGISLIINYDQQITTSALGHALETPALLIGFGLAFIAGGVGVIYGLLTRHVRIHTISIMSLYFISMFGSIVDIMAWGFTAWQWLDTFIIAVLFAVFWLYWKFRYSKYGR